VTIVGSLTKEQGALVADIKHLIEQRERSQKRSRKFFEEIRAKVAELHKLCPKFSNADLGDLLGVTDRWVARVLGAKTPTAKAHTKLIGQLRRSIDSISGERDMAMLTGLQVELEAMLKAVTVTLKSAETGKKRAA
jgi:predicted XRE-type DNA-binding protein